MRRLAIIIFRYDLRLKDNPVLVEALKDKADALLPVFIMDDRFYGKSAGTWNFGYPRLHGSREQFLLECLRDLKEQLKSISSDLLILKGPALSVIKKHLIPCIPQHFQTTWYMAKEHAYEEKIFERQMEALFTGDKGGKGGISSSLKLISGAQTVILESDLPFGSIAQLPDVYSNFRVSVEKQYPQIVREPLSVPLPLALPALPALSDEIQKVKLDDLVEVSSSTFVSEKTAFPFKGGERAALARLEEYFWQSNKVQNYKETRNGLLGPDYSTKFSPWLAFGCISGRYIMAELKSYESQVIANQSTYWVWFELLWRDYFRFVGIKYGSNIFKANGLSSRLNTQKWIQGVEEDKRFQAWCNGTTGVPFVDANMRELKSTGFMSNRGRQNVASFLVKDLMVDWRKGAEWFESYLLDYDPFSNYGNWLYVAGLGNDPREDRYFNVIKQAKDYDKDGTFVKTWCPELANLNADQVHMPWLIKDADFPKPIVIGKGWLKFQYSRQKDSSNDSKSSSRKSKSKQ